MSRLDEVGEADGWRCWLCDEPVDPDMSVNDSRAPSVDSRATKAKAKAKGKRPPITERLAHRGCNTGKGAVEAVVPWPEELFVVEPVSLIASVDRFVRKGGREVMARCLTDSDANDTLGWLLDRIGRLEPGLDLTGEVESLGGQHLVILRT